jgi:HPt (histidine-containing phosphotransfer) domain-containing protein
MLDGHVYWDSARALERLGGDEGLFREIVQIFLHEAPKHLAGLRQALAQRDKDSVERIAHTLK